MHPQDLDKLVLVTGGTGHLGRDLVARLLAQGRRIRVLARRPGADPRVQWAQGDLATGEGLRQALAGVGCVVHAATFSPIAQRGSLRLTDLWKSPDAVDVHGTRRLLEESRRARVEHFLHVSIVGLDPRASLPYNRVKLAGEMRVRESDLPWSVVRAAPFYYLLASLFSSIRRLPWWVMPDAVIQPVDTRDAAAYLAECLADPKPGMREEIGGPEIKPLAVFAQEWAAARGLNRRVRSFHVSEIAAGRMGLVAAKGRRGAVRWADWLAADGKAPGQ
ncbi:MAG: NAD(P)H-binding protein [Proteobacteria bacterium]|nr:NAD(P)H-binding protein [Pseudomonadota bacterium]